MATVCVKGVGKIKKAPDTAEINVRMERFDADYGKSSEKCAQATETLKTALKAAGFKESALKTASFSVSAKYENVPDKGAYKSVLTALTACICLKCVCRQKAKACKSAVRNSFLGRGMRNKPCLHFIGQRKSRRQNAGGGIRRRGKESGSPYLSRGKSQRRACFDNRGFRFVGGCTRVRTQTSACLPPHVR